MRQTQCPRCARLYIKKMGHECYGWKDYQELKPAQSVSLDAMELQIVEMVRDGATNEEMARKFKASESFINNYLRRAMARYNAPNRVTVAVEHVRRTEVLPLANAVGDLLKCIDQTKVNQSLLGRLHSMLANLQEMQDRS